MIPNDITTITNFIASLLMAKFALNDVPHAIGLTRGNGGGEAFEHFMLTGKYLWKGREYDKVPRELEVDKRRGVIYLHNLMSGKINLRVRRIPDDLIHLFKIGTVIINLKLTPLRRGGANGRSIKISPVFLSISGAEELLAGKFPGTGDFTIENKEGQAYFEFRNVPGNLIKDLWLGNFVDITLGYTGR